MRKGKNALGLVLMILLGIAMPANAQLQSPAEFLGYTLGDRFTPHHRVIDYFEHVASVSDQVMIEQYGETNEGRPLITAFVASLERMEQVRPQPLGS